MPTVGAELHGSSMRFCPLSSPLLHQDVQVAQRYRRNLALRKHASLLKLWHKINGAQISRQTGSRRFCHTFSTYSWSWNACRELVTAEELQAQDRRHRRFQPATRQPPWKKWLF